MSECQEPSGVIKSVVGKVRTVTINTATTDETVRDVINFVVHQPQVTVLVAIANDRLIVACAMEMVMDWKVFWWWGNENAFLAILSITRAMRAMRPVKKRGRWGRWREEWNAMKVKPLSFSIRIILILREGDRRFELMNGSTTIWGHWAGEEGNLHYTCREGWYKVMSPIVKHNTSR